MQLRLPITGFYFYGFSLVSELVAWDKCKITVCHFMNVHMCMKHLSNSFLRP